MEKFYKRKYLTIAIVLLCFVFVPVKAEDLKKTVKYPKVPWEIGEDLLFSIRWGFITAGYANMAVTEEVEIDDRRAYRIVTQARSAAFFDPFYKVRDIVQSYMDKEKLHTMQYKKELHEGSYEKDTTIIYDHNKKVAYENGHKFDITEGVQDVLSALYYLRVKDMEVGKVYEFDVGTGKKLWPLRVTIKKREKISVPAGKFDTYLVIPELREEGIFKAKGKLKVWMTADEKKIPVLMKSKIPVGSISAVLIEKKLK